MRFAIVIAAVIGCGNKPEPPPPVAVVADAPGTSPSDARGASPDAAPPPADAAPSVDAAAAAAADEDPRTSELCGEVLVKIVACRKDKTFLAALADGADAKRKAADKKHLRQIVKWRYTDCGALPTAIEDGGFLEHWHTVASAPGLLDSCAKLGAAVRAAGGLFGGDVAN